MTKYAYLLLKHIKMFKNNHLILCPACENLFWGCSQHLNWIGHNLTQSHIVSTDLWSICDLNNLKHFFETSLLQVVATCLAAYNLHQIYLQ